MAVKMDAERRISKIQIALMREPTWAHMSGILMVGKSVVDETCPTAKTNGRDKTYGRKFVDSITDKALTFVIIHEAYHVMYRHLSVWEKLWREDPMLANAAMDFVINDQIMLLDPKGQWVEWPVIDGEKVGLHDIKYRGMNTKQVFDELKKQKKAGDGSKPGNKPSGQPGGQPGGPPNGEGFDEHDFEDAKAHTEAEKKELEREVDQAIRQGLIAASKMKGSHAGGMSRELSELLEPKIDWKDVLREFITSTCNSRDNSSWSKVNRRFIADDIYLPSLVGESIGHVLVGIDMSGSVSQLDATKCLTETYEIMKSVTPDKVDLLYWDHVVAKHEEYDPGSYDSMPASTKPAGGGGTSPSCVTNWMEEHKVKPECVIMLTDGYVGSDWGNDWPCPVLWVITGGNRVLAPNGTTIPLNDD